jgi:outer membrane receptor protein involved in Fe transport
MKSKHGVKSPPKTLVLTAFAASRTRPALAMNEFTPYHSSPLHSDRRTGARCLFLVLALAWVTAQPAISQEPETTPSSPSAEQPYKSVEGELEDEATQATTAPPAGFEVLSVKGRAVTTLETEVPESITQFDAADIEALGAQDIGDLATFTPNVEIRTAGATSPTFFIRGVGLSDFNANAAGAVAIYQDDIALNSPAIQLPKLFDVGYVDVLRGPQGGGSGRNASAGAIKMYSVKPTGELTSELRSTYGNYNYLDFAGAIETPLIEETLAARLAFRYTQRDPYGVNGCAGAPALDSPDRLPPITLPGGADQTVGPTYCGNHTLNPATGTELYPASHEKLTAQSNPRAGVLPGQPATVQTSDVPEDLPRNVNNLGSWGARGMVRFQPPGTNMDWLFSAHGGRLDELSVLGQAIGTRDNLQRNPPCGTDPNVPCPPVEQPRKIGSYGGKDVNGYRDWNVTQMFQKAKHKNPNKTPREIQDQVATALASGRPLDKQPHRGDYNRVGETRNDTWGGFLNGSWSIGSVNFTSISGADGYDRFRDADQDFTPNVLFESIARDNGWQFTQELRVGGELEETPLTWEFGGFYLMEELHYEVENFFNGGIGVANREYDQDLWSFGIFAGFVWDFMDDFVLEGGVRYNWERKTIDYSLVNTGLARSDLEERTWTAPTGTLSLTYYFREDVSAYWKYSRGWKGGHFNASASLEKGVTAADPEVIDSFEAGMKGLFFDGRVAFDASIFYYKYEDYQVFVIEDTFGGLPQVEIVNANDAEVYGAESSLRVEPLTGWVPQAMEALVLTARFSWLESQFLDFTTTNFKQVPISLIESKTLAVQTDHSGNRLINSPQFKVSISAEWTFDLGRWGMIIPRYDAAWSDDVFFGPNEGLGLVNDLGQNYKPACAIGQCAFWLHNLRLAYRTGEGNIEIAGWVRNVTNEVYKTYAFDASSFANTTINFVSEPRMFGLDVMIFW